jgi:hypothetical protein
MMTWSHVWLHALQRMLTSPEICDQRRMQWLYLRWKPRLG